MTFGWFLGAMKHLFGIIGRTQKHAFMRRGRGRCGRYADLGNGEGGDGKN